MEKIINYKFKDFIKLNDFDKIEYYTSILSCLKPSKSFNNTEYRWWKKEPKTLFIKAVRELSFGEVTTIRTIISDGSIESVIDCISMITGIGNSKVVELRIIDFYSVLAQLKFELEELAMMEINELSNDDFDIYQETVNATERMARFGILNAINSLANDDITKWKEIQDLPYMTVFTKLKMDKEKIKIQKEIDELHKKKNKQ